jgi:chromosome segregation ATPase
VILSDKGNIESSPVQKLEKKLKLTNLLTGKKFADLELKIGKLEEKINGFSTDFPKLKERSERVEDLLNIINLGLVTYKKKFDDLSSRLNEFKNMTSDTGIAKTVEEKTLPKTQIPTQIGESEPDLEEVKRDLGAFPHPEKSLERTSELTDLKTIMNKLNQIETNVKIISQKMDDLIISKLKVK